MSTYSSAPAPVAAWDMTVSGTSSDATLAPFVADMTGSSSATVGALQVEGAQVKTVHAVFEAVLDVSEAVVLLNSFDVIDTNASSFPNGGHIWKDLSNNTNLNARVDVELDLSGNFKSMLQKALEWAAANDSLVNYRDNGISAELEGEADTDVEAVGGRSINNYFAELVREMVENQLSKSGLINILEPSMIHSVSADVDEDGASASMRDRIIGDVSGNSLNSTTINARRLFFTQINRQVVVDQIAKLEGVSTLKFLPMKGGQSITFVFDTIVTDPAQLNISNPSGNANNFYTIGSIGASNTYLPGNTQNSGASINFLNDKIKRRIAVIVHLGKKDSYFGRNYITTGADGARYQAFVSAAHDVTGLSQEMLGVSGEMAPYNAYVETLPYTLEEPTVPSTTTMDVAKAVLDASGSALIAALNAGGSGSSGLVADVSAKIAKLERMATIGDYSAATNKADILAALQNYNKSVAIYAAQKAIYDAKKVNYDAFAAASEIAYAARKRPVISTTSQAVTTNTTFTPPLY